MLTQLIEGVLEGRICGDQVPVDPPFVLQDPAVGVVVSGGQSVSLVHLGSGAGRDASNRLATDDDDLGGIRIGEQYTLGGVVLGDPEGGVVLPRLPEPVGAHTRLGGVPVVDPVIVQVPLVKDDPERAVRSAETLEDHGPSCIVVDVRSRLRDGVCGGNRREGHR